MDDPFDPVFLHHPEDMTQVRDVPAHHLDAIAKILQIGRIRRQEVVEGHHPVAALARPGPGETRETPRRP
jgi:hypothetical protein